MPELATGRRREEHESFMNPLLSYDDAPVAIRDDIVEAHRRAWQHIAGPGSWWTGAQRVAIAREVRAAWSCGFCAERRMVVSPYMLSGEHSRASEPPAWNDLEPDAIIDAIHRIVTDPGRLGRRFYDDASTEPPPTHSCSGRAGGITGTR